MPWGSAEEDFKSTPSDSSQRVQSPQGGWSPPKSPESGKGKMKGKEGKGKRKGKGKGKSDTSTRSRSPDRDRNNQEEDLGNSIERSHSEDPSRMSSQGSSWSNKNSGESKGKGKDSQRSQSLDLAWKGKGSNKGKGKESLRSPSQDKNVSNSQSRESKGKGKNSPRNRSPATSGNNKQSRESQGKDKDSPRSRSPGASGNNKQFPESQDKDKDSPRSRNRSPDPISQGKDKDSPRTRSQDTSWSNRIRIGLGIEKGGQERNFKNLSKDQKYAFSKTPSPRNSKEVEQGMMGGKGRNSGNTGKGKGGESPRSRSPDTNEMRRNNSSSSVDSKGKGGKGKSKGKRKGKHSANNFIMMVGLRYRVSFLAEIEDVKSRGQQEGVDSDISNCFVGRVVSIDDSSGDAQLDFGEPMGLRWIRKQYFSKLKRASATVTHAVEMDDLLFNPNDMTGADDDCSVCEISSSPARSRPRAGGNQKLVANDPCCKMVFGNAVLRNFFTYCKEWWGEEVFADPRVH